MATNIQIQGELDENPSMDDRRSFPRFCVSEGTFAALSPESDIMGQIENISRGGLCFRYIVCESTVPVAPPTHIFVGMVGCYLDKMLQKTVEDAPIDPLFLSHQIPMRRRRIEFVDLTPDQIAQLDYFLQYQTRGLCE